MIYTQPYNTMNKEARCKEHNNLDRHIDRSNIMTDDVSMEQRSEIYTAAAHNDDKNGGKSRNQL